ncbi:uncharacterized protein [Haliotis cracherodii]|uniref:uncharacterized protein n=1 Tax=Haliotis cracherodii TaxID=6455 RepID=UPI0039EA11B7
MSSAEEETASCSSSQGVNDVLVLGDDVSLNSDTDFSDIVGKFDTGLCLEPDTNISIGDGDNSLRDSDSMGAASSNSSMKEDVVEEDPSDDDNAEEEEEEEEKPTANGTSAVALAGATGEATASEAGGKDGKKSKSVKESSPTKEKKKKKSPFALLRKLTKFDKKPKHRPFSSEFNQIRIDRLPQLFVAKYLGKKESKGLYGLHHVRKPVDEMVNKVKKGLEATDRLELPLVYIVFTLKGIDIREHKLNKVQGVEYGMIPIDFISYGVQDIKYWRVFTFIVVKELSSRNKVTECHAYLCDSSLNARKMALALGASFKLYSRRLSTEGKSHNFQVELRPPDELADAFSKEYEA